MCEVFPGDSYARVSNFNIILYGEHIRFHQQRGIHKAIVKEKWLIIGKVVCNSQKYSKVVILENKDVQENLKVGSIWKIEKSALKICSSK